MGAGSTLWLVIEIVCCCIGVALCSLSIYLTARQRVHAAEMYIKKRSKTRYFALNICFIVNIFMFTVCGITLLYGSVILNVITASICIISVWFALYLLLVKNWMIYYKFQWTFYTMEVKWFHIINPKAASHDVATNWFLQNHSTFGNVHYMARLFGVISFVSGIPATVAVAVLLVSEFHLITFIVVIAIFFLFDGGIVLFLVYIFFQIPYVEDSYRIHWETKLHAKVLLVYAACIGAMNTCFVIFRSWHVYLIGGVAINVCLFTMVYISTYKLYQTQTDNISISTILSNEQALHAIHAIPEQREVAITAQVSI